MYTFIKLGDLGGLNVALTAAQNIKGLKTEYSQHVPDVAWNFKTKVDRENMPLSSIPPLLSLVRRAQP